MEKLPTIHIETVKLTQFLKVHRWPLPKSGIDREGVFVDFFVVLGKMGKKKFSVNYNI